MASHFGGIQGRYYRMGIILITDNEGQTRKLRIPVRSPWFAAVFAIGAVFLLAGAALLGYAMAPTTSRVVQVAQATAYWDEQIEAQRRQIQALRHDINTSLHALARRIGRLQAQITRLNAAAKRMVKTAGLDPDVFSFGKVPPIGGPQPRLTQAGLSVGELQKRLQGLSKRLDRREHQMHVLRNLMIAGKLRARTMPSGMPVEDAWISSTYGWRTDPFTGARSFHAGIDFATQAGAKVMAVAPGVVTYAGWMAGYGLTVEIDHGNGYVTRYGHNRELLVSVGERVEGGEVIARVGSTGRSTGPHVHFEVIRNGRTVDPAQYIHAAR